MTNTQIVPNYGLAFILMLAALLCFSMGAGLAGAVAVLFAMVIGI